MCSEVKPSFLPASHVFPRGDISSVTAREIVAYKIVVLYTLTFKIRTN
jgi:hypothetical protein